jgi:hypothetical protein
MMFWEAHDEFTNSQKTVMKPVRVVMNNYTLSIFENSNYYSNILTFDMEKSNLFVSEQHPWCVLLKQKTQNVELCSFSMNHKDTSFVEEWNYDFELFKNQCHVDRQGEDVEKQINYRLKKKIVIINLKLFSKKKFLKIFYKSFYKFLFTK